MKLNFVKNNLISYLLIFLLIVNASISTISNYSFKSLLLKIFLSFILLVALFIYSKQIQHPLKYVFRFDERLAAPFIILILILSYLTATVLYSSNAYFGLQKIFNIVVSVIPIIFTAFYLIRNDILITLKAIVEISSAIIILLLVSILILKPFDHSTVYAFSPERWSHVFVGRLSSILSLVLLFAVLLQKDFKKIYFFLFVFGAGVYLTYLTGLRAAFLGLLFFSAVTVFVYYYFLNNSQIPKNNSIAKPSNKFIAILISATLILTLLLTLITPEGFQTGKRIENLTKIEDLKFGGDPAIQTRLISYKMSVGIFQAHPLFGSGFGGFNGYGNIEWTKDVKYPHNIVLELACELGLTGLFIFGVLFFMIFNSIYKMPPLDLEQSMPDLKKDILLAQQIKIQRLVIFILFFFSIWLALFSKDLSTQGTLWIFLIFIGEFKVISSVIRFLKQKFHI